MNKDKLTTLYCFKIWKKNDNFLIYKHFKYCLVDKKNIIRYKSLFKKNENKIFLNRLLLMQYYSFINNLNVTDELKSYKIKIIDGRKKIQLLNIFLNNEIKQGIISKLNYIINNKNKYSVVGAQCEIEFKHDTIKKILK